MVRVVLLARVQCVFLGGSSEPFFITLTLIDLVTLVRTMTLSYMANCKLNWLHNNIITLVYPCGDSTIGMNMVVLLPTNYKPQDCPKKSPLFPKEPGPSPRQSCSSFFLNCPRCRELIEKQTNACSSVIAWDGQGNPPMCPEECVAANKAFETLPNAKELACCDCGEGPVGRECNMRKMNLGAACGLDNIECNDTTDKVGCAPVPKHECATCIVSPSALFSFCMQCLKMCPSRPGPPGVVDCYTLEGMCARNSTCAPLLLDILECMTDTGFMNSTNCRNARMRIFDHQMRHGMPTNCSCITSSVHCRQLKAALGIPAEVSTAFTALLLPFSV